MVAVNTKCCDSINFPVIENLLFRNSLHYNNRKLDDCIPTEKVGKWLTDNKGKYSLPTSELGNLLGKLKVVNIPFIIQLIKGAKIGEGSIVDSNVIGKLVDYHGVVAEWLCLVNMESRYSIKVWVVMMIISLHAHMLQKT